MSTRTEFLAGAAALVVVAAEGGVRSFAMAADAPAPHAVTTLGSWVRMLPTGTVEVFTDKVEVGMGVATGFAQFVADELDIPVGRVRMMLGDTQTTVSAGGVGGSFSTYLGNFAVRHAAAEMRRILVDAAAQRLGAPASRLTVVEGVVQDASDPSKRVRYEDVMMALYPDPAFPMTGQAFSTDLKVPAQAKTWSEYKIAGSSVPRLDAAPKAYGRYPYVVDVKLPGMMHARMVYPPGIGRTLVGVDEASIRGIGSARVVRIKDFVAVVASREWDAIRAARALKVTWSAPSVTLPAQSRLADYIWTQPTARQTKLAHGDAEGTLSADAVEAKYFWPFQSHANMGPGCTVVDARPDQVTVWSGTQKTHALRLGISKLLEVPLAQVRVRWASDCGSYGRGGLEESAGIAALVSKAIGRPVRVQSMRADNTEWGNKAPAMVGRLRGKVQDGKIVGFDSLIRQFNGNEILSQPSYAGGFIAGQLAGFPNGNTFEFGQYGANSASYEIPNVKAVAELIPPFAPENSPLRTAHMRDPEGPGVTFIIDSFIDELAARANADPLAFRIAHLKEARHVAALQAAAKAADWETRPAATRTVRGPDGMLHGRGVAFATRVATIVATIAEVAVDPHTGRVRVRRIVCAQDAGFVVNPAALQGTIEANVIQSMSRALFEEVTFDEHAVTSRDWRTYPVAHMRDVPEVVVVMIGHTDVAPGGAGEPSSRPTAAAIANAIYDATGARVRTAPLTPRNVLAALAEKGRG